MYLYKIAKKFRARNVVRKRKKSHGSGSRKKIVYTQTYAFFKKCARSGSKNFRFRALRKIRFPGPFTEPGERLFIQVTTFYFIF